MNGILDVHQPHHIELNGNLAGVFIDGIQVLGGYADGRNHAG